MSKVTNKQLVDCFTRYLNEQWGYVYGARGELYTQAVAENWEREKRQVPEGKWSKEHYFTRDCAKWFDHNVADCMGGLICALSEYDNGIAAQLSENFRGQIKESGTINTLPNISGLVIWKEGHVGLYVGGGYAIEFRGTDYGCIKTKVEDRYWTHWGKIKGVEYYE